MSPLGSCDMLAMIASSSRDSRFVGVVQAAKDEVEYRGDFAARMVLSVSFETKLSNAVKRDIPW